MNISENTTPNRLIYLRFIKNKGAVIGMFVIIAAIFVALLAYLLASDASPNANNQITEIQLKEPGYKQNFILQRKNTEVEKSSFLKRAWLGKPNEYKWHPYDTFEGNGDSIVIVFENSKQTLKLADIVHPLDYNQENLAGPLQLRLISGEIVQRSNPELISDFRTKHLETKTYWLGTDKYGRDVLSRLLIGVRISLLVGLIAVIISLVIGTFLGSIAGYFGGRVDDVVMFLVNTVWSIPTLLLVFAIVLAFGKNIFNIFLAVGLTMWVDVARIVRGQVMTLSKVEFIEAAKISGIPTFQIVQKHLLPNILGPLTVVAAANFATAILLEAGLSYLGFGIQPPIPSWGTMLNENYGFAISGRPVIALVPALAILLLVLAFNLVGNGLRDAIDVKSK